MANGGRIDYTIGFNVDKTGLNELYKSLSKIQSINTVDVMKSTGFKQGSTELQQAIRNMEEAKKAAAAIGPALQKSFNTRLNTVSVKSFEQEINKTYGSVTNLITALNKGGAEAQQMGGKLANSLLNSNISLQKTSGLLDKISSTLLRTLGWSLSSGLINRIIGSVQQAIGYVEHLDSSLNDIRIVTKKTADEMDTFALKANNAAKALGKATTDYTEAALIYYQQGLSDEEVKARAETTLKAANVTGQATKTVSEQLTAVWNGFKVNAEQTEEYVDKLAAVAATSASNLEELSTGMSKVASAASNLGVDIDQLTAQISTIVSVTRQAPESVGTALKTIYARISDLTLGGTDEDGVDLGKVSGGLEQLGIHILDSQGDLRELGQVIEEVAEKWDGWTAAQQAAIAQLMAGKRQYNNLVALFSNWDMYENAINTSRNATGELQKQQDIYMESTEAHLNILKTQWEDFYDSVLNSKTINNFATNMTKVVKVLTDMVDGLGGGGGILTSLLTIFSGNITDRLSTGISNIIGKSSDNKAIQEELDARIKLSQELQKTEGASKAIGDYYAIWGKYAQNMTSEQIAQNMAMGQELGDLATKRDLIEQAVKDKEKEVEESQKNTEEINKQLETLNVTKQKQEENSKQRIEVENAIHEIALAKIEERYNLEKQKAGELIKTIEQGLTNQNAPIQQNGATYARNKNLAENYSSEDIVNNWGKNGTEQLQADIISVQSEAKKTVTELTKLTNDYTQDFKNQTDGAWDRWIDKASNSIRQAQKHLGLMGDSPELKELSQKIDEIFTQKGKINKNKSDTAIILMQKLAELEEKFRKELTEAEKILNKDEKSDANKQQEKEKKDQEAEHTAKLKEITTEQEEAEKNINKEIQNQNKEKEEEVKTQEKLNEEIRKGNEDINTATSAIDAQNKAMEERVKAQERANNINAFLKGGAAVTSIMNMNTQLGNLAKNLASGQSSFGSFTSSLIMSITSGVRGFQNLNDAASKMVDSTSATLSGFGTILTKCLGPLKAITIAVGVFKLIQGAIQGAREQLAKYNQEAAESQQKITDSYKKELDAVTELVDKYKEIDNAREENGELTRDQKNQIYDLVQAYGDEDLMLLTLAGKYDEIAEKLKKMKKAKEEAYASQAENEQLYDREAFISQMRADYGSETGSNGVIVQTNVNIDQLEKDLQKTLGTEERVLKDRTISWDNIIKLLTGDQKRLNELLKKYQNDPFFEQLAKYQNKNSSILERYQKNQSTINDYAKSQIIDKQIEGKSLTSENYQQIKEEILQQFKAQGLIDNSEEGYKQGEQWISSYLQGVVEGSEKFTQGNLVAENIASNISGNINIDEIINQITEKWASLSESQQNFIASNTGAIAQLLQSGSSVEEVFSQLDDVLQTLSTKDHRAEIDVIISGTSKKKIQESIDALFNDKNFELGMSKEQFMLLDKATQKQLLIAKQLEDDSDNQQLIENQTKAAEILNEKIEQRRKELEAEAERLMPLVDNSSSQKIDDAAQSWREMKQNHELNYTVSNDMSQLDEESAMELVIADFEKLQDIMIRCNEEGVNFKDAFLQNITISEDLDKAFDDLNETTLAYFEAIFNHSDESKDAFEDEVKLLELLKKMSEGVTSESKKNAKELSKVQEQLDQLRTFDFDSLNFNIDYQAEIENIRNSISDLNKEIDNLQNTYETLNGIVEDYNADGYLTMDNLQQLMSLDDSYVASLELVNGQLKLNEDVINSITQNRLHAMEVEATELYLKELDAIANNNLVTASAQLDNANAANVASIEAVIGACGRGVDALLALARAKAAAEVDLGQTEEATKAYYNRIQMIKNLASQPISSSLKKNKKSSKSKGSSAKPKTEKELKREEDIYRVVNQELSNIESALSRIDKINSHRWGVSYKKNLEQQNKLLNQQLSKLKEKNKLQVDDLATRRKQLEKEGVIFSDDGSVLQNGEEVLNKLYAEYNEMVNQYNKMSASRQESFKADMETKKNYIDALEKKMSDYESGYADMLSNVNEQLDTHYQIIENQVSHFNAEVEVKLELKNAEKDWNDFWKEVIEDVQDDDFIGQNAANIKQLKTLIGFGENNGESIGEVQLDHLKDNLVEVDKLLNHDYTGIFKDDVNAAKENLEQYRDQLMSTIREAEGLVDNIAENYLNQLKSAQDLIDKQLEKLSAIDKHISHNIELIKLIDGEKAFDAIDAQYQNKYQNNLATIETQRASKEYWETQMAEQKALLDASEKGSKQWQTANKAYEEAVNGYIKATGDLDAAVEQALQDLKEQTENANAKILDTLDKAMSGGIGLDLVEEEWKLINDEADKYYDNVERYINMEEYTHQLNEAADAIGLSAANQQKLNQFREEELKQLNKKERLTSYDIEESRARLEILKQELALQDAQANKSKMRLRRDAQGNYNYQYVADENAIEEAENGLLTAKKEWYSIVKKRYQDLSNDIISIQKQQLEYAKQIKDAESAGDIERLNKYKELYNQNAEYLKWAMTEAEKNKRDMYNGTQLYFKQVDDTTLEQSKTTIRQLVDQWAGGGEQSFIGAVKKAITDLDAAQAAFQTKTNEVLSAAGTDYDNLVENNIDPTLDKLNSLTDKDLMEKLDHIAETLKNQWDYLVEAEKAYTSYRETAVKELETVIEKLKELAKWQDTTSNYKAPEVPSAGDAPKLNYSTGSYTPSSGNNSGNNSNNPGGPSTTSEKKDQRPFIIVKDNPYSAAQMQVYNSSGNRIQDWVSINDNNLKTIRNAQNYGSIKKAENGTLFPKLQGLQMHKRSSVYFPGDYWTLRSGGYTGSWGDDSGRWALLHQKELVLNENDTKNMLSAVQILRSIPYSVIAQSLINSSTNTASALSGINSGISGLAAAATNNESKTMVVNADFSGVHDADEIYQALLELENYGLQNSYSVAPHANSMY